MYLYLLTNDSMPGLMKIGCTTGDVWDRAKQLRTSGVPAPFRVKVRWPINVEDSSDLMQLEKAVHTLLNSHRYCNNREFFEIDYELASIEVTDYLIEMEALDLERMNRESEEFENMLARHDYRVKIDEIVWQLNEFKFSMDAEWRDILPGLQERVIFRVRKKNGDTFDLNELYPVVINRRNKVNSFLTGWMYSKEKRAKVENVYSHILSLYSRHDDVITRYKRFYRKRKFNELMTYFRDVEEFEESHVLVAIDEFDYEPDTIRINTAKTIQAQCDTEPT